MSGRSFKLDSPGDNGVREPRRDAMQSTIVVAVIAAAAAATAAAVKRWFVVTDASTVGKAPLLWRS
ncbi:hypothetical protein PDIDSM_942 [Penicillium digitatum]|nr:hypothetical protein PDIDSM_942 [Penicillium digitatum]